MMLFNLLFATVKFRFLLAEDDKFTEQVKFLTSSESEDYVQVLRGVDMLDDDKGLIGMMFPTLVFNLQPFSKRKNGVEQEVQLIMDEFLASTEQVKQF